MYDILKNFDPISLLAIGFVWWSLRNELGKKIDRLNETVQDMDRRICRIEGSLATQGHCLFGQKTDQKTG